MFNFFIILAFVTRLLLMPISAHSDLFFINSFPNLLVTQRVFDIYSYFDQNLTEKQYNYYPSLTYYTFGFFQFIYQFFSDSFSPWMQKLFELQVSNFKGQAADFIKAAPNANIFRDLFLAKLPYLIFDLAAITLLAKFIKNTQTAKSMILVWLFNPVSIYASYLMGQFELIPAFFVLLGFFLLRKNLSLGILLLGVAAALKNYAFLLIIPAVLIYGQSYIARLKLLTLAILPYIISLIPTLISSADQAIYALLPKVYLHYRKPLEGWPLYSQTIKYVLLSLSYLAIIVLAHFVKIKDKWRLTLGLGLTSLLLVYALAPRISFHYLLWATPLILLYFKNLRTALILIVVQAVSLASYKLLANHLQAGLFVPLNPNLSQLPTVNSIIDQVIPYRVISSVGFFIFFLLNLFLAAKIILDLLFKESISGKNLKAQD